MSNEHIYRVTVRGRFAELNDRARAQLVREQPEHDIFKSAYTSEGTFTYDPSILFFNLRYEVRTAKGIEDAELVGRNEAELFLSTLGYGYKNLKINVVDTSTMWSDERG